MKCASDWNFGDLLDIAAATVPGDRPALIHGDRLINWQDFDARTNRLARSMLSAGLPTGARVAILARNIPEYIEIACAAFKARLTHVNINYRYTTSEIEYVLNDCQASALFYQSEFSDRVAPLFDRLPGLALGVQIDGDDSYDDIAATGDGSSLGIARTPEDGYLLYTGGTTGQPKGVMWRAGDARAVQMEAPTVKNIISTPEQHKAQIASNNKPGRVLPACPLMHGAGLNSSMAELVMGGTVILSARDSFDAETLWDEVELNKVTRVLIVGNVFARPMAQALEKFPGRWDLSEMRVISSAGQMWSREAKQTLVTAIPQLTLVDILGASEASGFGYAITTKDRETPTGYFEAGKQTVIIDVATDRVLDDGESGQGWLARRRPFAQGYFGDPDKTAATYREIDGELYAIPGDVAERDESGLIHLIGRGNLCINSGGEKIFVEEVEEALKRAPGVEDAIVVGTPDPKWGQAVIALVAVDASYVESDVRDALKQDLANYKIPKRIDVLDKLPRQPSGKGDYRMAAELAMKALAS